MKQTHKIPKFCLNPSNSTNLTRNEQIQLKTYKIRLLQKEEVEEELVDSDANLALSG